MLRHYGRPNYPRPHRSALTHVKVTIRDVQQILSRCMNGGCNLRQPDRLADREPALDWSDEIRDSSLRRRTNVQATATAFTLTLCPPTDEWDAAQQENR